MSICKEDLVLSQVKLMVVDREGVTRELAAMPGAPLMNLLRDEVDMRVGVCGGMISCGSCHVRLCPSWAARITPPSGDEAEMLEALGSDEFSRLSCQILLDESADGMSATLLDSD